MLGQLRDRFFSLQEEISASVKNFAPSTNLSTDFAKPENVDLNAGADLLETWQTLWEELHLNNEKNAQSAARCDYKITDMKLKTDTQWDNVMQFQSLAGQLPKIGAQIGEIMDALGNLESQFEDVEISLLTLEDTIDAKEMQEKQLDESFQLAMYQEKRKAEFNELSKRLNEEYQKKKAEKRKHGKDQYRDTGLLPVPAFRSDPDASLESVDLDDEMESFLGSQSDVLFDVSPLPRDEPPPVTDDAQGEEPRKSRVGPDTCLATDVPGIKDLTIGSVGVSRDESFSYTTDEQSGAVKKES